MTEPLKDVTVTPRAHPLWNGRSSRLVYWLGFVLYIIPLFTAIFWGIPGFFGGLVVAITINHIIEIRRLHDLGIPYISRTTIGLLAVDAVPVIGDFLGPLSRALALGFTPGTPGSNQFGPAPKF